VRIRYTSTALSELVEILAYLSDRSPAAADAVARRIDKVISTVSSFPHIGQEIDQADVRMLSLVRYPYLIFYRARRDEIEILHIRHGARQRPDFD
jgi:plasmid stabilization system protein ParE